MVGVDEDGARDDERDEQRARGASRARQRDERVLPHVVGRRRARLRRGHGEM